MQLVFIVCQIEGYRNILKLSCRSLPFYSYTVFLKNKNRSRTARFLPHFLHDFWRKIFFLLCSIIWPNFFFWLPLLREILANMCIVTSLSDSVTLWYSMILIAFWSLAYTARATFERLREFTQSFDKLRCLEREDWKLWFIGFSSPFLFLKYLLTLCHSIGIIVPNYLWEKVWKVSLMALFL